MKHKRNIFGQSILKELRKQSEDINLSSEDGLKQINLNDDVDKFLETEMLNQSGIDLREPVAPKNKRDENEPLLVKVKAVQVWALKKSEKVMMELDADGQGRDNGSNLFVRFLGQVARRIRFCPISIKIWDKMTEDNKKTVGIY
ncbi:hypothetical protein Ahy_B10g105100 [Arachis hypogaea]|uniref:Uncharacterized protein n=1 Tax=Arachis hypogaea TaxID=3818 RepID=A0A444X7L3_ARAHY|nr:hypothetical protein Ahy_B10g105100 [Arachis hypogaea]